MPSTARPSAPRPGRRRLLGAGLALLAAPSLLSACSGAGAQEHDQSLALEDPLPTEVPPGTALAIGDPRTQRALEVSGLIEELDFTPEWANFSGGPRTSEAFRAGALDAGAVADIPPLHARWTGLEVRNIVVTQKTDPLAHPTYSLGVTPAKAPSVRSLADLRGLRIVYSPGQAQGALVLRILRSAGLTQDDVELVELASTDDTYATALAGDQLDVAPLGTSLALRYLAQYEADGATTIPHGLRDDRWNIYVLESSLRNPAKAAALAQYARAVGRATAWITAHREEWTQAWYVEHEGLSPADAERLVEADGDQELPLSWDETIALDQETEQVLRQEQDRAAPIDVEAELFDRRFEEIGAAAYREAAVSYGIA